MSEEEKKEEKAEEASSGGDKEVSKGGKEAPAKTETSAEETDEEVSGDPSEAEMPPADFTSFILSISTSALMHLGQIENPMTKKVEKNAVMAKHSIDLIEMIKEKTKGNLEEHEEKLLENIMHDLRMTYVNTFE